MKGDGTCAARWHGIHLFMNGACVRCTALETPFTRTYDQPVANAETLAPETHFTCDDRCDRCGAQAQHRVQLNSGVLLFCGHHMRQHAPALALAVHVPRSL